VYKVIQNAVALARSSFIFGIIFAIIFGVLKGRDVLLYGYFQTVVGVIALVFSKGVGFIFHKKVDTWVPGTWEDLSRNIYENIPVAVKLVSALQYLSLFYTAFVLGWLVFSALYFWIK